MFAENKWLGQSRQMLLKEVFQGFRIRDCAGILSQPLGDILQLHISTRFYSINLKICCLDGERKVASRNQQWPYSGTFTAS